MIPTFFSVLTRLELAVTDQEYIHHWRVSKAFTVDIAERMPAESYGFRLSPQLRTFGELMVHIAASQADGVARIACVASPVKAPLRLDREDVVRMLCESFDFCIAQLGEFQIAPMRRCYSVDGNEGNEITGAELVLGLFQHTAHHRGQAEMYLRAVGIQPPGYRF